MADVNPETAGIDNLRAAYEELKTAHEALQTEHRELKVTTAFNEVGLNPKHAKLFLKANGDDDITVDSVKKFAEEYELQPAAPADETTPPKKGDETPPPEGRNGLKEMAGAGQQAGGSTPPSSPGSKMSQEDFQKLLAENPQEAVAAYRDGRVATVEGNTVVERARREGVMN